MNLIDESGQKSDNDNNTLEELHATAQKLREKYAAAVEQMDELRKSLSFIFPHELRTPLTVILGFSQFLAVRHPDRWPEPEMMQGIHEAMYESALRMEHLIENYLVYVQLQLKKHAPEKEQQGIWQSDRPLWTESLITSVALSKAEKGGRTNDVKINISETEIRMSKKALQKIVEELLDNAFEFSEPGTPVHIMTHVNETQWTLTITDQGRGMTVDQIAKIEAFMQFDRQQYEQQGSGLGLIIARLLAQANHGELLVESIPEQGTTVRVKVPKVRGSA